MWFVWAISALTLYLISTTVSFLNNLRAAKKTGLPIVISPVSRLNIAWILLQKRVAPVLARLPFGLGSFTRYSTLTWWFDDKYRMHQQYGKVFIHVSPGMNELHCADPLVNQQIFSRKKDFEKPPNILKATKIYGDSISTVTGSDWQRHRRITIPPFNERNNKLVWDEALRQTIQAAAYWSDHGSAGFNTISQDWATVTLNILATAALGESWEFCDTEKRQRTAIVEGQSQGGAESRTEMTSRRSIMTLAASVRLLVLTPTWLYSVPPSCLPNGMKQFVAAYKQFGQHMEQMVNKTKDQYAAGENDNDATFLNTLVLKSEEIYGNLFTYNIAGHETTAGTLGFAIYLLVAFPECQEWVWKEVDAVYKSDIGSLAYEDIFPKLKRCLAIMLETLRLYGPIHSINKATVGPHGQELVIAGQTVLIPPNTFVIPNVIATHTLPEFWGDDHLDWKPDRWISPIQQQLAATAETETESIRAPPKGKETYFPWSGGGRVCPGQKFSQVEFVAIISVLLRGYRIQVVPREGETEEQARRRCLAVVQDSETQITLQMRNPSSVKLRLVKRQH